MIPLAWTSVIVSTAMNIIIPTTPRMYGLVANIV